MRIVITTGPSYEPLDRVRRLSNSSTGELGTLLAEALAQAGHNVICFRAEASTFAAPLWPVEVVPFATNADLATALERLPGRDEVAVLFHAAALCDYRVALIQNEKGESLQVDKIASRDGSLQVTLEPTPKLIGGLRRLFPATVLVGWKYEVSGTAEELATKGRRQMEEYLTDACVLNGRAYGAGFGMLSRAGEQTHLPDKPALCRFLVDWTDRIPTPLPSAGQESFHALSSFTSLSPFI
jgi:phosphopantothenoylcysteine synthetase/decarboxylase